MPFSIISSRQFHKSTHRNVKYLEQVMLFKFQPFGTVYRLINSCVQCLQAKGKTSPLEMGKFQNHIVNVDIRMLMNVEDCQGRQPLRTHGVAKQSRLTGYGTRVNRATNIIVVAMTGF